MRSAVFVYSVGKDVQDAASLRGGCYSQSGAKLDSATEVSVAACFVLHVSFCLSLSSVTRCPFCTCEVRYAKVPREHSLPARFNCVNAFLEMNICYCSRSQWYHR